MTGFDRVVQYVSGYDPDFPTSIRGASEAEIAELESLIGGPLPDSYRGFLLAMGRDMDWVRVDRFGFGIDIVLRYYRRENWLPRVRKVSRDGQVSVIATVDRR